MRMTTGSRWRSSGRWSTALTSPRATSSISLHSSTPQTAIPLQCRPPSPSATAARRHGGLAYKFISVPPMKILQNDVGGRGETSLWANRTELTPGSWAHVRASLRLTRNSRLQTQIKIRSQLSHTAPPPLCQHRAIHHSRIQPSLPSRARLEDGRGAQFANLAWNCRANAGINEQ